MFILVNIKRIPDIYPSSSTQSSNKHPKKSTKLHTLSCEIKELEDKELETFSEKFPLLFRISFHFFLKIVHLDSLPLQQISLSIKHCYNIQKFQRLKAHLLAWRVRQRQRLKTQRPQTRRRQSFSSLFIEYVRIFN